jgi:radical SAM protein with 4Fe4S-binding SPASM domain
MSYESKHITISPHCCLKRLEEPCLYDIANDELYEINEEAYQFLLQCSRGEPIDVKKADEEFIQYCLSENLITLSWPKGHLRDAPVKRDGIPDQSPIPSLRYLEFQLTDRCNLRCRHCYIGEGLDWPKGHCPKGHCPKGHLRLRRQDLPYDTILAILKEFEKIQGLRLLLSGGEPLLHPRFWEINEVLRDYAFRSILLSNGTLITQDIAKRLRIHEVQVSLDGMEKGHEAIRGEGTFTKTLCAIDYLQEAGIRVSLATMIHRENLIEFDSLASLIQSKKIGEWNVDLPSLAGRMEENRDLWVSPEEAGPFLHYGFGGGLHSSGKDSTCGTHLCAILANGRVAKCGLFSQEPIGSIAEGLRSCWERIPRIGLKELGCNCAVLDECRGGCRYRAKILGDIFKPDLFQCYARGVLKGGEGDDHQKSV